MKLIYSILLLLPFPLFGQFISQPLAALDTSGGTVQLDARNLSGVLLFFTSVRCPYDEYYVGRMNDLHERFGKNIRFYFVNASPEDTPAAIQAKLKDRSSVIPYLIDRDQVIRRALGVNRTTETVLLRPEKGGFAVVFRGPVDDNPQVAADADRNYLRDALEAFLAGRPVISSDARVAGCLIREP